MFRYRGKRGWLIPHPVTGDVGDGETYGAVLLPGYPYSLTILFSGDGGWEHVSVSTRARCPTWGEMCRVKALFWDDEDTVLQFHPPESQYVNRHRFCLHMWRRAGVNAELPPLVMV